MRLPEPRWELRPVPAEAVASEIPQLARTLGAPPSVARLLWLRGHRTAASARAFLSPRLADLSPPEAPDGLPDAGKAADRITRAVRGGERIVVCGDYDVDGMTGTALLVRFLDLAGADVGWAIPDRAGDGYGLSAEAVERLHAGGARLLVTVDNGISAHEAIDRAAALGIDVVVTDHHLPPPTLPAAHAIVTPRRGGASGDGAPLCGCALAFKTAWAVADRLRGVASGDAAARFREFLRDAVGLVALATIADVVPLVGENRILVSAGLASLRASEHPGVRALMESARVGSAPLTAEDVAFRLAPRINAAGRLSRPDLVVDLLTSRDAEHARGIARTLEEANEERRAIEKGVLAEALSQAEAALAGGDRRSLVLHGDGWHRGVIGIVAARLVDLHGRPTVVIGMEGDSGRGSCRTRVPVDLHRALSACGPHLARYGGHAQAAGLDIRRDRLEPFRQAFEEAVRDQVGDAAPGADLLLDGESTAAEWTLDAVEAVHRLAPFGAGNPEPRFLLPGVRAGGRPRLLGETQGHLAFTLPQGNGGIRVIAFRRPELYDLVASGAPLDLAVTPTVNEWRGIRTPELRLVDARPAEAARQAGGA